MLARAGTYLSNDPRAFKKGFEEINQKLVSLADGRYVLSFCSTKRKGQPQAGDRGRDAGRRGEGLAQVQRRRVQERLHADDEAGLRGDRGAEGRRGREAERARREGEGEGGGRGGGGGGGDQGAREGGRQVRQQGQREGRREGGRQGGLLVRERRAQGRGQPDVEARAARPPNRRPRKRRRRSTCPRRSPSSPRRRRRPRNRPSTRNNAPPIPSF